VGLTGGPAKLAELLLSAKPTIHSHTLTRKRERCRLAIRHTAARSTGAPTVVRSDAYAPRHACDPGPLLHCPWLHRPWPRAGA